MHSCVRFLRTLISTTLCLILPTGSYSQDDTTNTTWADSVYVKLKDSLQLAKELDESELIAQSLIAFGDFYKRNGAVNQALLNYQKAADYLSKEDTSLVYIQLQSGIIQFRLRQYPSALDYFNKGLGLSQSIGYKNGEAMCAGFIGSCYEKLSIYDKAIVYQKVSLDLFIELEHASGLALAHENLGSIYEDLQDFDRSLAYFEKALFFTNVKTDADRYINILNNIADIHRKTGDFNRALVESQEVLVLALKNHNQHQIESAYKDISKVLYELKAYQEAFLNLKLSDSINEVILQDQNRQQLNALQSLYDAKTKNARIEVLLKENEIGKVQNRVLWLGVILLFTLAGGSYFYQRNHKKQQLRISRYKQKILEVELENKLMEQQSMVREIELKTSSLSNYSLNLAQRNKTLTTIARTLTNIKGRKQMDIDQKLTELVREITKEVSEKREWERFMEYFSQIHPLFIKKLQQCSNSNLTASELRLCMLIKLNMTSSEMAEVLKVTPDSIRVARYRLRKKLPIDKGEKLVVFLLQIA
ncbi:tetratricopeptide repeat protein [Galbibacter sp.]|uniref:tetratricopeptide repeat protein n=1 Tax=Galbibacter sp. TaxID=2918471 RepID=UPI003A94F256